MARRRTIHPKEENPTRLFRLSSNLSAVVHILESFERLLIIYLPSSVSTAVLPRRPGMLCYMFSGQAELIIADLQVP